MTLLICIYAACLLCESVSSKLISNAMQGESKASYSLHYVTHSVVACLFFLAFAKFSININATTLVYAMVFGADILLALLIGIFSLRYMNVLGTGILSTPFILLLTALVGAIAWGEEITVSKYLAIALTSVSSVLIFLDLYLLERKEKRKNQENEPSAKKRVNIKAFIPLMCASIVLLTFQNAILKSFAVSDKVTDENSFYFLTNVFILVFALVPLVVSALKRHGVKAGAKSFFKPKRVIPTAARVVSSNVTALLMIPILAKIDVSAFTPMSSAFSIIVGVAVSLFFKEKFGIFSYLAAIIAVVAIFV